MGIILIIIGMLIIFINGKTLFLLNKSQLERTNEYGIEVFVDHEQRNRIRKWEGLSQVIATAFIATGAISLILGFLLLIIP